MHRRQKHAARFCVAAACAALLAFASGCARNDHVIDLDTHFSMNVVKTPRWFGDKETVLTQAESEVLLRRGPPDFIRFWWRTDGSYITSSDLTGRDADSIAGDLATIDKSWIFKGEKEEVLFPGQGRSYRAVPLDPVLAMVCDYGDPSFKSQTRVVDGVKRETWQWIEQGVLVELADGKLLGSPTYFQATGVGTWGLK